MSGYQDAKIIHAISKWRYLNKENTVMNNQLVFMRNYSITMVLTDVRGLLTNHTNEQLNELLEAMKKEGALAGQFTGELYGPAAVIRVVKGIHVNDMTENAAKSLLAEELAGVPGECHPSVTKLADLMWYEVEEDRVVYEGLPSQYPALEFKVSMAFPKDELRSTAGQALPNKIKEQVHSHGGVVLEMTVNGHKVALT